MCRQACIAASSATHAEGMFAGVGDPTAITATARRDGRHEGRQEYHPHSQWQEGRQECPPSVSAARPSSAETRPMSASAARPSSAEMRPMSASAARPSSAEKRPMSVYSDKACSLSQRAVSGRLCRPSSAGSQAGHRSASIANARIAGHISGAPISEKTSLADSAGTKVCYCGSFQHMRVWCLVPSS
jgi:hypothetical protein